MGRISRESALLNIQTLLASSHPLFSVAATSLLLIILYVPCPLLFSQALIAIFFLIIITAVLRSSPTSQQTPLLQEPPASNFVPKPNQEIHLKPFLCTDIVDLGPPIGALEVIYEEYEGDDDNLSSDTGSSSNSQRLISSPVGNFCFPWEDDDADDDGMIEIKLEEENLIEIDISDGYCR